MNWLTFLFIIFCLLINPFTIQFPLQDRIYKYKVPDVGQPSVLKIESTSNNAQSQPVLFKNLLKKRAKRGDDFRYQLRSFRTLDNPLTPKQLEWAMEKWNITDNLHQWKVFNYDANYPMIAERHKDKEVEQVFAYRRAVIDENVFSQIKVHVTDKMEIDYFDDYQSMTNCSNPKVHHSRDKIFQFRNKTHYVKFSYVCDADEDRDPLVCEKGGIVDMYDNQHGEENEWLRNFTLRTNLGKEVVVKTWRVFHTCELHFTNPEVPNTFVEMIYPTLPMRLDAAGLTNYDIIYAGNLNYTLALRLFGQELLRPFRQSIPDITANDVMTLEQTDRQEIIAEYRNAVEAEKKRARKEQEDSGEISDSITYDD